MAVKGTAVVTWQEELAKQAAAAASGEPPLSQFLSFRGGQLTYNEAPIPGNKLEVIVLDSAFENAWYPWAFDPNKPKSPACYAVGRVQTELAPREDEEEGWVVEDRQSDVCATCDKNEWGSDPDGGKGKACKNQRRLSLIDANVLKTGPEGIAAASIVYARLPVTSVKLYSSYIIQIANVVKRPPYGVISELSVVPDPRSQFLIKWSYIAEIPDAAILALMEKNKALVAANSLIFPYPPNVEEPPPPPNPRVKIDPRMGARNGGKKAGKLG